MDVQCRLTRPRSDLARAGRSPDDEGDFQTLTMPGGLYATTSFVAFILTPLCSAAATLLANIPFFIKGYKFEGYADDGAAETKAVDVDASRA